MPVIEVNHLTKEYRLGALQGIKQTLLNTASRLTGKTIPERPLFKALDDVNFSIEQGEVVGIIGHNGAGKSTLLKMLAKISTPTRGSVKVTGRIAPLIEVGAGFVPDFTGRENVYLNAAILGMSRREIDKKFDEIVDFAEMSEFIDTPVKRYSSGMQVKLAFAVATSIESEILIVDEVLAVGDLAFQRKCFDRMEDLIKRQGRTVLLVSHNIRQVERLCTRVLLMNHGMIAQDGASKDVCNTFYAASDKQIHESKISAFSGRSESGGDIELESVTMLDASGKHATSVEHLQDIEFQIKYRVKNAVPDPIFGIGIHTTDFLYLATSQSLGELKPGTLSPGIYVLSYKVRKFPFLPGVYSLRLGVALGVSFQPVYYSENVMPIHVVSGSINRAVTGHINEGFVSLEATWAIETGLSAEKLSSSGI
ncbi:MAG: ABC transporter ATP-binding protein [Sulfuriferula multivorans]|uniref:ABC transporter ATP-binding protein n=1 Tax=Sulfuriferula multivorans TaxID=1559896 RepID=A0A7C9P4U7_9PROT|nr:ABC transporter ATP-binding protein [Sulfuriferula multivorans]